MSKASRDAWDASWQHTHRPLPSSIRGLDFSSQRDAPKLANQAFAWPRGWPHLPSLSETSSLYVPDRLQHDILPPVRLLAQSYTPELVKDVKKVPRFNESSKSYFGYPSLNRAEDSRLLGSKRLNQSINELTSLTAYEAPDSDHDESRLSRFKAGKTVKFRAITEDDSTVLQSSDIGLQPLAPSAPLAADLVRLHMHPPSVLPAWLTAQIHKQQRGWVATDALVVQASAAVDWVERLIDDFILEKAPAIVKETVRTVAWEHVQRRPLENFVLELVDEVIFEAAQEELRDRTIAVAFGELVLAPVVNELLEHAAWDVVNELSEKRYKDLYGEVSTLAAENFQMGHLLALLSAHDEEENNPTITNSADISDRVADDIILDILIQQSIYAVESKSFATKETPVRQDGIV